MPIRDGVMCAPSRSPHSNQRRSGDVADRINKAFARKTILTSSIIQVTNSGSTIYLDGTTDSRAAMQTAEDTAWDAPGVTEVIDRLVLIP